MKSNRLIFLCTVVALPQLVLATTSEDVETLAISRAVLSFCSSVDPKDEESFRAQAKIVTQSMSEQQVASLLRTSEYKQLLEKTMDTLESIPKQIAKQICAAGAVPVARGKKRDD